MSWIGSSAIHRAKTEEEVYGHWDQVLSELPNRVNGCNSLSCIGTFTSEKEARSRIDKMDRHAICGMVYAKIETGKESTALRDAKVLLEKETKKKRDMLIQTSVYKTHNGKTVGCQRCGSSFPVAYFKREKGWSSDYFYNSTLYDDEGTYIYSCPICGRDMRSTTTHERLNACDKNIEKYRARVEKLQKEEKHQPYYLYRTEAYCG